MSQKSTVLLLFEDPDADAPGVDPEVAFVEVVRSPVGVSFHGKKCSEKGLASEINTSKVCLQGEEIKVYSDAFFRKICPKLCLVFFLILLATLLGLETDSLLTSLGKY